MLTNTPCTHHGGCSPSNSARSSSSDAYHFAGLPIHHHAAQSTHSICVLSSTSICSRRLVKASLLCKQQPHLHLHLHLHCVQYLLKTLPMSHVHAIVPAALRSLVPAHYCQGNLKLQTPSAVGCCLQGSAVPFLRGYSANSEESWHCGCQSTEPVTVFVVSADKLCAQHVSR
jgi:hypothetical protein